MTEHQKKDFDVSNKNSEALASVVVIHRVLGSYKNESKICMIELMKRRQCGEDFNFEEFIGTKVEEYQFTINTNPVFEMKNMLSKNIAASMVEAVKKSERKKGLL